MADIDFASIRTNVTAALEASPDPVATSDPTPVATEPVVETPPPVAEMRKFKLKDPEGEFEVDEAELKNGHLRFRDYTRKTQGLADERKQLEATHAALTQREQQINAILNDAENVAKYYEFLTGKSLTAAQTARVEQGLTPTTNGNSDDVATLAEAQKLAQAQADEVRQKIEKDMLENVARTQQWTQQQIDARIAQAETARVATDYHSDILSTISALGKEFPMLAETYADPSELEDILVKEVMKAKPETLDQAKEMLASCARERNERLEKAFTARHTAKVVEKATLTTNGIEPTRGTAPGLTTIQHPLGSKESKAAAIAYFESVAKH